MPRSVRLISHPITMQARHLRSRFLALHRIAPKSSIFGGANYVYTFVEFNNVELACRKRTRPSLQASIDRLILSVSGAASGQAISRSNLTKLAVPTDRPQ
jgi:hypothetical protein